MGPATLVASICDPFTPNRFRAFAADELMVRYRIDLPFDTMLSRSAQHALLASARDSVAEIDASFEAGGWFLNGQSQRS
jgi:hypothetical protein